MSHAPLRLRTLSSTVTLCGMLVLALAAAMHPAQAQTFTVLYAFTGGTDGKAPEAGLVMNGAGDLYGTTNEGGSGSLGCITGCGTVFRLDAAGNLTVLHSFGSDNLDGESPLYGSLLRDPKGNLYGMTTYGGAHDSGTIFRLGTGGKEAVFSFPSGANGGFPYAGLVPDAASNLYGTTAYRGTGCPPYGCGTVFMVTGTGKETVLHSFAGTPDGAYPYSTLIRDSAGNLYGTTFAGGVNNLGTVFKVDPAGKETVLYSFAGGPTDGASPYAGLVLDGAGNLYGTTAADSGTVFKLDPSGHETVLYTFSGDSDGGIPFAGLVRDNAGNLYGTTYFGGNLQWGAVFKVDPAGNETVLHSFYGPTDGAFPLAGLTRDSAGNLYGTTSFVGPKGWGTVFKISP